MDKEEKIVLEAEILEICRAIDKVYEQILDEKPTFRDNAQNLKSMGYNIHNLYCAYEQLFAAVANFFENQIDGSRYHTHLLRRMRLVINGMRPALISPKTHEMLDELRGFQHFFRHAYGAELDPDRLERVVGIALQLRKPFRNDMDNFLEQLK